MKTLFSLESVVIYGLLFSMVACSEDEEAQDVRDQAVGTYNYTAKLYEIEPGNGTLEYLGPNSDHQGSFTLTKTDQGLEAKEGRVVLFRGSKVTPTTNGFGFEIDIQDVLRFGLMTSIKGYKGVALGSVKYHGGFFKPNSFEAWFQRDVVLADPYGNIIELTRVVAYTATKT